ncbi:MAG: hypothetical protein ALMCE001_06030 [Methanocorpusculum sp. MCE]|nr:MAG: hypothetical protein ALMCE001_06030 [Methanocorpusculum sp. MCE]
MRAILPTVKVRIKRYRGGIHIGHGKVNFLHSLILHLGKKRGYKPAADIHSLAVAFHADSNQFSRFRIIEMNPAENIPQDLMRLCVFCNKKQIREEFFDVAKEDMPPHPLEKRFVQSAKSVIIC